MIFNSIEFAIFLPIVFLLYWFVFNKNLKLQNLFVVAASYFFYGWWDWRFLILIAVTSFLSFFGGLLVKKFMLNKNDDDPVKSKWYKNKAYLLTLANIIVNLGILFYFKYFNFFVTSFAEAFSLFGKHLEISTLKIILPVGISFYTFQALSYTIDVYRKKIEPTKDIVAFFAFVSFFPQLVAGPIERATNLLPQFYKSRVFDYNKAVDGMRQILWGLFKKIVVADNCATYVNAIFNDGNYITQNGSTLVLAVVLFAFQLYCDFSGYSDIAIGTARLFGVNLMRNFNYPYFATSFSNYWQRNHISLTTWFMDYVYYPMIGSSEKLRYWNFCMIVTFLLSGMWHGANWTFILWGLYQGVFIVISLNFAKRRKRFEKKHNLKNSKSYEFLCMFITFAIVCFGLIFFRAETIGQAMDYILRIFNESLLSLPTGNKALLFFNVIFICILLSVEWVQRNKQHGLEISNIKSNVLKYAICIIVIVFTILSSGNSETFIYFQF